MRRCVDTPIREPACHDPRTPSVPLSPTPPSLQTKNLRGRRRPRPWSLQSPSRRGWRRRRSGPCWPRAPSAWWQAPRRRSCRPQRARRKGWMGGWDTNRTRGVMVGTTVSGRNGGVAYGGGGGGEVAAADSRAGKADRPAAGCKPGSGGVLRARSGDAEEVDRKSGRGKHTRRGSSCGRRCAARTRILGAGIRGDGGVPPGCGSAGCWRPRRPPSSGQGMRYAFLREKLRLCLRLSSILRPQ
jgi:hypothetical protein